MLTNAFDTKDGLNLGEVLLSIHEREAGLVQQTYFLHDWDAATILPNHP